VLELSGDLLLLGRGITVLVSVKWVKLKARAHSMMPPAMASPKDSPKEPAAEFTPAASLTRSSAMGARVKLLSWDTRCYHPPGWRALGQSGGWAATQDRPSAAEPDAIPPVEAIAIPPVPAPDIRLPEITADTEQAGWP
jgi:hypothetical protein